MALPYTHLNSYSYLHPNPYLYLNPHPHSATSLPYPYSNSYLDSYRNPHSNPYAHPHPNFNLYAHSYPNFHSDPYGDSHAYSYPNFHSDPYGNPHAHSYSNFHPDPYRDSHAYSYPNRHSNSHGNLYAHPYRNYSFSFPIQPLPLHPATTLSRSFLRGGGMRFYIITLGCPKNEVDSRGMERKLLSQGHIPAPSPRQADVLIINTCGFIEKAREESLKVAREYIRKKKKSQRLIIAGCLPQLWGRRIAEEIPEADAFLGTRRWMEIGEVVERLAYSSEKIVLLGDPEKSRFDPAGLSASWGASAYLKIAEGCSSKCAFCTIPAIKGPAQSFPRRALVEEARRLVKAGVKELILVSQNTTAYGLDRGEKEGLVTLIEEILEAAPELRWLRIMYASPLHITERLIQTMSSIPQICHYLDLPLQHAHPEILKRMRRPYTPEKVKRLVEQIRLAIPDIALRTTFIVGYPGETEEAFNCLKEFMEEMAFDRVGIFIYSPEEGTPAASLPDQVPEEIKEERYRKLMSLQQRISYQKNLNFVGKRLEILVEGYGEGLSIGRSYRDAPEIDGLVLVQGKLQPGEMVQVRVVKALEYDLIAEA